MKKRGLVQYAREYILYSHALVRANIFCIILEKKEREVESEREREGEEEEEKRNDRSRDDW